MVNDVVEIIDGVRRNTGIEIKTDLTGATLIPLNGDGNKNRTHSFTGDLTLIFVDGMYLHDGTDYTYDGITITFLNGIWDQQNITIWEQI